MLFFLRIAALGILILHALAYFLPAETWWSVKNYTVLPIWVGVPLSLLTALTLLPGANRRARAMLSRLPILSHPRRWAFAAAVTSMPLFWLLRIRHLNWGDARILVDGLAQKDAPVLYNWQAPFTVFLHQRLWQLLANPLWGWGVDTVYAAVSVLCGAIFVFLALEWAQLLGKSRGERALLAGMLLTGGGMELFFGYIENYTIISVGILAFLWLGVRVLRGESSLWAATLVLALTNAFHPSTVVLWPALLWLAWHCHRRGMPVGELAQSVLLPPLLVGSAVLTLMTLGNHGLAAFLGDDRPGGGDHIWFVPIVLDAPTQWQRYAMFSAGHFADWGNELLLVAPLGALMALFGAVAAWRRKTILPRKMWFLGAAALGYLLLTWAWNADYGIQKDWDLFSPVSIPLNAVAGVLWLRLLAGDDDAAGESALIVWAVGGLHTLAWVLSNVFV